MRRTIALYAALLIAACTVPAENAVPETAEQASPMEGTFEYVDPLRGQSIMRDGRWVFLYGPADGGAPMTGEAGTYEIVRDTAIHTVAYSTDPDRVGTVFRWTLGPVSGDTAGYVVMDETGQVTGRGRSVRRGR